MSHALRTLAHHVGVYDDYWDQKGNRMETGPVTDRALLTAMGLACATDEEAWATLESIRAEEADRPLPRWMIFEPGTLTEHGLSRSVGGGAVLLEDGTHH